MSALMESTARLHRADPEALKVVMANLREAATPKTEEKELRHASATGRVQGTLTVMDVAVEAEGRRMERRASVEHESEETDARNLAAWELGGVHAW